MIFLFVRFVNTYDLLFLCLSAHFDFYPDFVLLTVYRVNVFVVIMLLINEIKVTFTQHVLFLYVAKCWLN